VPYGDSVRESVLFLVQRPGGVEGLARTRSRYAKGQGRLEGDGEDVTAVFPPFEGDAYGLAPDHGGGSGGDQGRGGAAGAAGAADAALAAAAAASFYPARAEPYEVTFDADDQLLWHADGGGGVAAFFGGLKNHLVSGGLFTARYVWHDRWRKRVNEPYGAFGLRVRCVSELDPGVKARPRLHARARTHRARATACTGHIARQRVAHSPTIYTDAPS